MNVECRDCEYIDYDEAFGWVCQHKASMEGIEAEKNFYTIDEIEECDFYLKRTTEWNY